MKLPHRLTDEDRKLGHKAMSLNAAKRWARGKPNGKRYMFPMPTELCPRIGQMALATDAMLTEIIQIALELYLDEHFGQDGEKLPQREQQRLRERLAPPEPPKMNGTRPPESEDEFIAKIAAEAARRAVNAYLQVKAGKK